MAQVDVTINDQNYRIACEDGQQEHLRALAGEVDKRITDLVSTMGQIGELRLLVMASMLMADEMGELRAQLETARGNDAREAAAEAQLAGTINSVAQRIETVAAAIERA